MIKRYILILGCLLTCFVSSNASIIRDTIIARRVFQNICADSSGCIISIKNEGDTLSVFKVQSDHFFKAKGYMLNDIYNMQIDHPNEPLERLAWMYVIDKINYCRPFSEEGWMHYPELMVNSLGNGLCDDMATLLSFIWKDLMFESRIWTIEGHVVPEVYVKGKWHMYDPSYQVYYLNKDNKVASVEEIAKDTTLMNRKVYASNVAFHPKALSSSKALKNMYATTEDNFINEGYNNRMNPIDIRFYLPKKSSMTFPIRFPEYFWPYKGADFPEYTFAEIKVADSSECSIKVPLVLHNIKGKGKVSINDSIFTIGSEEIGTYIKNTKSYIEKVTFVGNHSGVRLHYFVNERLSSTIDELVIKGTNIKDIAVEWIPKGKLPTTTVVDIDSILEYNNQLYLSCKTKVDKLLKNPDTGDMESLTREIIVSIIQCDKHISPSQKQQRIDKIEAQLDYIHEQLGDNFDNFFKNRLSPGIIIVVMAYLENLDRKTLKELMMK